MVRLKDHIGQDAPVFKHIFQFHYGTIKSTGRQFVAGSGIQDFNSTMVRLKEGYRVRIYLVHCSFQFHYGTIKSLITPDEVANLSRFQFHYGTIKSATAGYLTSCFMVFQFHYGTIKSGNTLAHPKRYSISIPLWYD